jgi:broad specificity phosphatase PhoE
MLSCWLIRHGESEANAGLPTTDPERIKLTARGVEQSKRIARAFEEEPTLIVVSPYLRARQTARPTLDRFPHIRREEWAVQEFTYLAAPRDRALTFDQRRPLAQAYWTRCDPFYIDGPGAESFSDLMIRVERFVERLARIGDGAIAVFSHGQFMQAVVWSLLCGTVNICPDSMGHFRQFLEAVPFPNGAFIRLCFTNYGDAPVKPMLGGPVKSHLSPDLPTDVAVQRLPIFGRNESLVDDTFHQNDEFGRAQ